MTTERREATIVETLSDVAKRWNLQSLQEDVDRLKSEQAVHIGFLGEFSSGKSTLINELTGVDDLLPVDLEPTTASAGQVVASPDVETPEYCRLDPDGTMTPITCPDFDDLCRGRTAGRPLVRLPPNQGFPAGYVFLDTPGLGTLITEHVEVTLGTLPFVDAAVICVDIREGGLSRDVTTFLTSPGVRHLQHRFLIALTFADRRPTGERNEVVAQVASTLSRTVGCSESEAAGRIVVVSAGRRAAARDVSALRSAIQEAFESRRESLTAERQARTAGRLVPHAISLLDHVRTGLLESDQDFTSRREKADDERARLENELGDKRRRLAQAQTSVRQDLQAACDSFRSRFAAASNDQTLQQVSADFSENIANVIGRHLTKIGQDAVPNVEGLDADIQRVVRDTNRITSVAATMATAALGAIIIPGVGAGASAAEGTASAAARAGASRTAASAVGKKAAGTVAQKAAEASVFARGAKGALIALHDLNPVNIVSDFVAEWWKGSKIDEPMDRIRTELSDRAASEIEAYFEQEVFQPLEGRRDDVQRTLAEIETKRRTDLTDRTAEIGRVDADIEKLRTASGEHA